MSSVVKPSRAVHRRLTFDRVSLMVVFLGVPVALYLVFVLYPFTQAAWYSLTSWSGFTSTQEFIGFDNYAKLAGDPLFLKSVGNSLVLLLVVPALTLVLSFALACLLTFGGSSTGAVRGLGGSSFYRVVSFFPYVVPAIVVSIIFGRVYDPSAGLLNGILTGLGIDRAASFAWLGEPSTAKAATIVVIVWAFVGFYMVLFVAAIRGIPAEVFEAARIDGAGRFRTAVSIAVPGVGSAVRTAYVYLGIFALDAFVFLAGLEPDGGPANSTLVITQEIFRTAFKDGRFGLACAMGVVLAVLSFLFTGIVFGVGRLLARRSGEVAR
ncbi:carbohydrate ABC transporter permease [Kineococcus rhizosphaerae]|uniref:carbohydrate ABC transporter permease n=1 Tax=Kineococcus rhizosphaerae TaxID=559628 RepID=UPI001B806547|nr:sugar ABC transporter permease [Kineococcus rhizosphaerae]